MKTIKAKKGTVQDLNKLMARKDNAGACYRLMVKQVKEVIPEARNIVLKFIDDEAFLELDCNGGHVYVYESGAAVFQYAIVKDGVFVKSWFCGKYTGTRFVSDKREINNLMIMEAK